MINFTYDRATTVASAAEMLRKNKRAKFIAGGTNLMDLMKRGVETPEAIIDITRLPLKQIEKKNGKISIGALAANSVLSEDKIITEQYPLLSLALKAGASPQLRNMATVGGNMMQRTRCPYYYDTTMPCNKRVPSTGCGALEGYNRMHAIFGTSSDCIAVHPSDMCVALVALDATVQIQDGSKIRTIPFADFHRLPGSNPEQDNTMQAGEIILGIELPDSSRFATHNSYVKIRDRNSYAFALVSVAASMEKNGNTIKEARLAMGGVAHKPWRLKEAEAFLKNKNASEENFKKAADLALQGAKAFKHNAFKIQMSKNAIVEALLKAG